jgi:hypothetical protein
VSGPAPRRTVGEACAPYNNGDGDVVNAYTITERLTHGQLERAAVLLSIAWPSLFETVLRDGPGGAR